jgi:putative oxidoreductase
MGFLKPHTEKIYALLRMVAGFTFMLHGMQKVLGLFGGMPPNAPAFVVYGAGTIELVGGLLIAVGLFAAPAAFLCSGTMAVAFFVGHVVPAKGNILPIMNKGELAALYCWLFLFIAAKGAGIWSVDAARRTRSV